MFQSIVSDLVSESLLYFASLAILALLVILSAAYMLRTRSLVYSAYALALIGLFNAGIFSLLGFTLIAAIQVVIYVGAAVLFIILSYSLIGDVPVDVLPLRKVTVPVILLFIAFFLFVHRVVGLLPGQATIAHAPATIITNNLVSEYATALVILFLVAGTCAIEAIVIAKKELLGEQK